MKDNRGWKKAAQTLLVCALLAGMLVSGATSVCAAGKKVAISATKMTLRVGESKKLTVSNAKKVTWKSSKKAVASVSKNGKVTAKKVGKATITAKASGKKMTCRVTVKKAVSGQQKPAAGSTPDVTSGSSYYRGFLVDNVLYSKAYGDIHYHVCFPDSYDGTARHSLYITLPGYQGLYFQGVAENLKTEDFAFEAQKYRSDMVIVAPQLNDWGETSADQTIALTQYFLEHYAIDPSRVYINGYSGGGETLSLVLGKKPGLYTAALMCSSQWDGGYDALIKAKTPVYFVVGEDDEYYGSEPFKRAYRTLRDRYEKQGLSEEEIDGLLVLDVKDGSYFAGSGIAYQHAGGYLFCRDKEIMGWLFGKGGRAYTADTRIADVTSDAVFGDYGRLIFPVDAGFYGGNTLGSLSLTWYNNIDPDKTVEICNYMRAHAQAGDTIFYDIYTDEEKAADPAKKDTGLFFFKGKPGEKFAVCNAGGGFAYVGAMHDSFPHALELSKMGYNAFALIYRPGWDTAVEDLARALKFISDHAGELEVDMSCYSLWGGSAGARMAAELGTYGPAHFGGVDLPRPGTVVMQYTGHNEYGENDPPTYACVGTNDGIASWQLMKRRLEAMAALGIPTEFHAYKGLGHGFGLGTGTVAEGWIRDAVAFWERQM